MAENPSLALLSLPIELLEEIILSPVLSLRDVCALRRVNWKLHYLVGRLWGRIAAVRWQYWDGCTAAKTSHTEWHKLCKDRHVCEVHTVRLLNQLTVRGMKEFLTDDDDLECVSELLDSGKCSREVLLIVLNDILRKPLKQADLTQQFYSLYAKEYVLQREVRRQWRELCSLPEDQQLLEKGALLVAQWMNPCRDVRQEVVSAQLDSIAAMVAAELIQRQQRELERDDHGSTPKSSRLDEDILSRVRGIGVPAECVLDTMNTVMYDQLGFKAATSDHYYNLENSYIDRVLERRVGIPITMSTVYEAVARRLGVTVLPVNFPSHFLLKLQHEGPHPGQHDPHPGQRDPVFIDAYARGRRSTAQECMSRGTLFAMFGSRMSPDVLEASEPMTVFMRMAANIYSSSQMRPGDELGRIYDEKTGQWSSVALTSALTLQLFLCSLCSDVMLAVGRAPYAAMLCIELNYSTQLVERILSDIATKTTASAGPDMFALTQLARDATERKRKTFLTPPEVKQRKDTLCYHVGMIMKHKRYDYRCVIYGWDHRCEMSDAWIQQMGVDTLPHGRNQPFYNVLVEDGTNRYASEENLFPCPASELVPITHWEVGKYFCKFLGDRYVANFALRQIYEQDEL